MRTTARRTDPVTAASPLDESSGLMAALVINRLEAVVGDEYRCSGGAEA
jgi:hypothetical protein